jgi:hypothetical protein
VADTTPAPIARVETTVEECILRRFGSRALTKFNRNHREILDDLSREAAGKLRSSVRGRPSLDQRKKNKWRSPCDEEGNQDPGTTASMPSFLTNLRLRWCGLFLSYIVQHRDIGIVRSSPCISSDICMYSRSLKTSTPRAAMIVRYGDRTLLVVSIWV